MMRALVTGASGFIGSHLVQALVDQSVQVVAVDIARPRFDDTTASLIQSPFFMPVHLDITRDPLDTAVSGCDVVFHLAARSVTRRSWGQNFHDYLDTNVLGTQQLVEACLRQGVARLVFASSSSVYGWADWPSGEDDECRPTSPYGVTKLAAEQLCMAYAKRPDSRLTTVALRYFTIYGPRQRPDMTFARLLYAAYSGTPLRLTGDASQRCDFTYISDAVAATIAAAQLPCSAEIINIGGGASASLDEAIQIVSQITGRPLPVAVVQETQPGDTPAPRADLSLARELLDYQPSVDLSEGLARQAAWLRELPLHGLAEFAGELVGSGS